MTDVFTTGERSEIMRRIRSKNTVPEIKIRSELHRLGYRYRLHYRRLPGKPDIVLPRYRTVIEIRGCFWHAHDCGKGHIPKSNQNYWKPKLERNKCRDRINDLALRRLGWRVIVVWECRCKTPTLLAGQLKRIVKILMSQAAGLRTHKQTQAGKGVLR